MEEDIRKVVQLMPVGEHKLTRTSLDLFPGLSIEFYDENTSFLEKERFVKLGDFEDETASAKKPANKTCQRGLVGDTDTTIAVISHVPKMFVVMQLKVVEFCTEFSNGHMIFTSNAPAIFSGKQLPNIQKKCLGNRPIAEVLSVHRDIVNAYLNFNPYVSERLIRSYEDMIDSQQRYFKIYNQSNEESKKKEKGKKVGIFAGLIMLVFGFLFFMYFLNLLYETIASRNWPSTTGKIVYSGIHMGYHSRSDDNSGTVYSLDHSCPVKL